MALARQQLRGAQVRLLLTLCLRGKRHRFGEAPAVVDNGDPSEGPGTLRFGGGLAPVDVVASIGVLAQGLTDTSVPIELAFQGDTAHTRTLPLVGRRAWAGAWAELALHRDGDDWADRWILARGRADRPQYGGPGDPVRCSIVAEPWEDAGLWPPATARVSGDTWPRTTSTGVRMGSAAEEEVYPMPFGEPGLLREGAAGTLEMRGAPALLVEIDDGVISGNEGTNATTPAIYLIGGARLACAGVTGSVKLFNLTTGASATFTPSVTQDALQRDVTVVQVLVAALTIDEGDEVWWSCTVQEQGGLQSLTDSAASFRGAGDSLRFWVDQMVGVPVDRSALAALVPLLNGLRLDYVVNVQTQPWQFITDELLPLLPLSPAMGPAGLYFVLWRWNAGPEEATVILGTSERQGARAGPVQVSSSAEVYTDYQIEFGLDRATGKYLKRLRYVSEDDPDDSRAQLNYYCASASRDLATVDGIPVVRHAATLQTDLVLDDATAQAILDMAVLEGTSVKEELTWTAPQEEQSAQLGSVALVSDPDLEWVERVAIVMAGSRGPGQAVLKLRTVPDRVRDD